MDSRLSKILNEVYEFGQDHDSKTEDRTKRMLNITPDTGLFLSIVIRAVGAKKVLEVGTSNGYSTIWIADALRQQRGKVLSVEASPEKVAMAKKNIQLAGLADFVDWRHGDARTVLRKLPSNSFDVVFMDAERPQYVSYWDDIDRVLKPGGVLLVDNALEPRPEELVGFFAEIKDTGRYLSEVLSVGKGEYLAFKLEGAKRTGRRQS